MAMLDLDKVINITSWGGGGGLYPGWDMPVPYPIVQQKLGLFNKPNAWDTDSNGWFGLLGSSNNAINSQNQNFNTQMAVAPVSGTGALSTRVKSYDFSSTIEKVDGWVIKYWAFSNDAVSNIYNQSDFAWPFSLSTFDINNNEIASHTNSDSISFNTTAYIWWSIPDNSTYWLQASRKIWKISTNDWIYYAHIDNGLNNSNVYNTLNLYKEVAGEISTTATISHAITYSTSTWYERRWAAEIIWVHTDKIYVWIAGSSDSSDWKAEVRVILYEIDLSMSINELDNIRIWFTQAATGDGVRDSNWWISSYISNGFIYMMAFWRASIFYSNRIRAMYAALAKITLDWNNIISHTIIYDEHATAYDDIRPSVPMAWQFFWYRNWYFDETSQKYYYIWETNKIYEVDSWGIVDTTDVYYMTDWAYYSLYSDVTKLSIGTDNVWLNNNILKIWGVDANGLFGSLREKSWILFSPNASSYQDDWVVWFVLWTVTQTDDAPDEVISKLKINWVDVVWSEAILFPAQTGNRINALPILNQTQLKSINIQQQTINNPSVEVELYSDNNRGFDYKLALGVTGWNYAVPTLPANNGLTGNATTPWATTANATYIDLSLTT